MKRTTIMADENLLLEAKHLAEQQGMSLSSLVGEALQQYLESHRQQHEIPFLGIFNSGDPTYASRDEEILAAEIDPIEGWSPHREPGSMGPWSTEV